MKIIVHLSHIYNAVLRISYFSTTLKSSVIVTVLKLDKHPEQPSSYWPISLLLVLVKILEKVILERITIIAQLNNSIPNFQFGFHSFHATTHQLHRVVDTTSTAIETKKYCAGVLLSCFWRRCESI